MTSTAKPLAGFFFFLFLAALSCGCSLIPVKPPAETSVLVKLPVSEYPEFTDDSNYENLEECISRSLSYLKKRPKDTRFQFGQDSYDAAIMVASLADFMEFIGKKPSAGELRSHIAENYHVYKSAGTGGSGEVLFTGYYEPFLEGSLTRSETYKHPVYGTPPDLVSIDLSRFSPKYAGEKITGRFAGNTVVPYFERKEIENGGMIEGMAPVIVWVKDRIDLFFLHIQGSGKIRLDTGEIINVHYSASNGRPYKSIGNYLIEKELIPKSEISMQKIRAYLNANPGRVDEILSYNPSYIFFKTEKDGPVGYLGLKLTPERSVALDMRLFPPAALMFAVTQKPLLSGTGEIKGWEKSGKFVSNQDTGGAIRGPGRADFFWGSGEYAETAAGHMQHKGSLYLLILKSRSVRD